MAKGYKPKCSALLSLERLCKLFGLPDPADNESSGGTYAYCYREAVNDGKTESEAEEIAQAAEQDEQDEQDKKQLEAILRVSVDAFDTHDLTLATVDSGKHRGDYRVTPRKTWRDAAERVRDTINGVGHFHFSSLRELRDSGPYTDREVVLLHLGYIPDRAEVYGTARARHSYDRAMRYG